MEAGGGKGVGGGFLWVVTCLEQTKTEKGPEVWYVERGVKGDA